MLYFSVHSASNASGAAVYAAGAICQKNQNESALCIQDVSNAFSHETLYLYANFIAGEKSHLAIWATYCRSSLSPNSCMSRFGADYDVFIVFFRQALVDKYLSEKLIRCHSRMKLDSFLFTRNKQCLYK